MLLSCQYCGCIHDSKDICKQKEEINRRRQSKFNASSKDKFRWSTAWKKKREQIRKRDKQLCQVCIRNLYNTNNQYTFNNLSVHHAISLEADYSKRLCNDNLITLCDYHHEMAENGEIPVSEILDIITQQENKSTPEGVDVKIIKY